MWLYLDIVPDLEKMVMRGNTAANMVDYVPVQSSHLLSYLDIRNPNQTKRLLCQIEGGLLINYPNFVD